MRTNDAGAALISVLLVAGLLAALGVSLVLVGDTERRMAANSVYAMETEVAADAALVRALVDLRRVSDWTPVVAGNLRSSFLDAASRPTLPAGGVLDLTAATASLQAETNALGSLGADTPVWRLYASGPMSALAPGSTAGSAAYLIVWVADDPADADGNASADANGTLMLRAEARGLGGARRAVEATVALTATGALQLISSREVS